MEQPMTRANEIIEEFNTFDPEEIEAMHKAYAQACIDLHVFAGDEHGKRVIAARVIDLAKTGVVNAGALRDRVVFEARLGA
jgi:hypothetical protein